MELLGSINAQFGAILRGDGLETLGAADVSALRRLLYEKKVLLFKGVSFGVGEYRAFAGRFGAPVPFVDVDYRHPEHPEIFVVSNMKQNGKRFGKDRVGYYWHSDSSFLQEPLPITMLYAQRVPAEGGETAFIDMTHVYGALSPALKEAVDSSSALHEGVWRYLVTDEDLGLSILEIIERDEKLVPPATHPLVRVHPATGARGLYLSEGISRRVVGIPEEAGRKLIARLWEAVRRDESHYVHRWEPGDLLLWDNRGMIHRAFPAAPGQDRMMFRIGVDDKNHFSKENAA